MINSAGGLRAEACSFKPQTTGCGLACVLDSMSMFASLCWPSVAIQDARTRGARYWLLLDAGSLPTRVGLVTASMFPLLRENVGHELTDVLESTSTPNPLCRANMDTQETKTQGTRDWLTLNAGSLLTRVGVVAAGVVPYSGNVGRKVVGVLDSTSMSASL